MKKRIRTYINPPSLYFRLQDFYALPQTADAKAIVFSQPLNKYRYEKNPFVLFSLPF